MCGGRKPKQPQVVYQGPSAEEMAASQASLESYRAQSAAQTAAFQAQIQQQIDAANKQRADLDAQLAADTAAAAAAAANQQLTPYAVTTSQGANPQTAETTTAATAKTKQPSGNLRINLAGAPRSSGTGLNIGI